jgi:pimeloyl-ACP methyl ester carboxylesterase
MPLSRCLRPAALAVVLAAVAVCVTPIDASAQAHYAGALGPGSLYEIDVPAGWNGDLVLYAHGIVEASLPVVPPTSQDGFAALRTQLLGAGFAVAASSYSSNGWALDDAVQRTHQLGAIVAAKAGTPQRTFLVGHSLGALAIVKLAETYPRQYDGVLAICGPLGGALAELEYAGNARVTFDYYFPGVLPGTAFDVPAGTQYLSPFDPGGPSPLFLQVFGALSANPQATFQWAIAAQLPFASPTELGNSSLYVIGFLLRYTNDLISRVNGKTPFDNQDVDYQVNVTNDPATNAFLSGLLNDGVERFTADPAAANFYDRNYTPDGRLEIPVLTLHTTRDPAIPFAHEATFAAAVTEAGRSAWLVQRSMDRWGHCAITTGETAGAFADLVDWATSGQRP